MATTYDVGDVVRTNAKFTTSTGSTSGKDPASVYFHLENPAGSVSTDSLAPPGTTASTVIKRTTTGEFYADITATGKGIYEWRWFSTGLITTAEEDWFSVRARRVTT